MKLTHKQKLKLARKHLKKGKVPGINSPFMTKFWNNRKLEILNRK